MKWLALIAAAGVACAAQAQEKVVLGMSGWTGFQPLKLAELAGIFKKNGVDIETRFIAPVREPWSTSRCPRARSSRSRATSSPLPAPTAS